MFEISFNWVILDHAFILITLLYSVWQPFSMKNKSISRKEKERFPFPFSSLAAKLVLI